MDSIHRLSIPWRKHLKGKSWSWNFLPGRQTKINTLRIPGPSQTNQRGELMARVKALSITLKGDVVKIVSDSMYAIQGIIENLREWEDKDWMRVQNSDIFQKIDYKLDKRGGETYFQWVKGHSNNPRNIGANEKGKCQQYRI